MASFSIRTGKQRYDCVPARRNKVFRHCCARLFIPGTPSEHGLLIESDVMSLCVCRWNLLGITQPVTWRLHINVTQNTYDIYTVKEGDRTKIEQRTNEREKQGEFQIGNVIRIKSISGSTRVTASGCLYCGIKYKQYVDMFPCRRKTRNSLMMEV